MATAGQRPRYAGTPSATATNPYRARKEPAHSITPCPEQLVHEETDRREYAEGKDKSEPDTEKTGVVTTRIVPVRIGTRHHANHTALTKVLQSVSSPHERGGAFSLRSDRKRT